MAFAARTPAIGFPAAFFELRLGLRQQGGACGAAFLGKKSRRAGNGWQRRGMRRTLFVGYFLWTRGWNSGWVSRMCFATGHRTSTLRF